MHSLGIREAVLTAKHGCGFLLWPTNTTLPDGSPYAYHVPESQNVLAEFSSAMRAAEIGHGFYYSLTNNFFLNVRGHQVQPPDKILPGQQKVSQASTVFVDRLHGSPAGCRSPQNRPRRKSKERVC